ncbi:MAG TPA: bifunctional nuclease family protein, partial [Thermomicrobiales bacterium]|nr:bifunctional nuclease family protein [Thermomicrobiales bacterium]
DGARHLPIWIGAYEAEAIALELQGIAATRPLPYDLIRAMLSEFGAHIDQIVISDLTDSVFYARIVISIGDRTIEIDARPSDAIAIAVRTDTRIFVDDAVMDDAGVALDNEEFDPISMQPGHDDDISLTGLGEAAREADAKRSADDQLGIFRDFINSLDLDDFDKGNQSS